MAISEESRQHLYLRLEEVLGREEAATLMEHLPPVGWADVATKRDIDALAVATKRDIDALAVATKRDIDALAVATKRDIDALEAVTSHRFDALESKVATLATREWIEHELRGMTQRSTTLLIAAFSSMIVFASVALAVIRT